MDNRPKKSLSLRRQGQKKLSFTPTTRVQGQGTDSSSAPQTGTGVEEVPATVSASSSASWLSGLCNLGNTCYANSILQVLRFCPQFSTKVKTFSELLLHHCVGTDDGGGMEGPGGAESEVETWQASKGALIIHLHKVGNYLREGYQFYYQTPTSELLDIQAVDSEIPGFENAHLVLFWKCCLIITVCFSVACTVELVAI